MHGSRTGQYHTWRALAWSIKDRSVPYMARMANQLDSEESRVAGSKVEWVFSTGCFPAKKTGSKRSRKLCWSFVSSKAAGEAIRLSSKCRARTQLTLTSSSGGAHWCGRTSASGRLIGSDNLLKKNSDSSSRQAHPIHFFPHCRASGLEGCKAYHPSEHRSARTTHLRQMSLSALVFLASTWREGSMTPPKMLRTRWSVDSFWML